MGETKDLVDIDEDAMARMTVPEQLAYLSRVVEGLRLDVVFGRGGWSSDVLEKMCFAVDARPKASAQLMLACSALETARVHLLLCAEEMKSV